MNYDNIFKIIEEQMVSIMQDNYEYYQKYEIILSNEYQYIREKDRHPGSIFVVVKFQTGSFNYGQFVQPIVMNVIAEHNKISVCQKLLYEYVSRWHNSEIREIENDLIKQTYTSPTVMSNFNDVFDGYRSLFYVSGVFLVGENSNPITSLEWFNEEKNEYEKIDFLSITWSLSSQLDPQAFYSTGGRTTSISRTLTFSINITKFQKDDAFDNFILDSAISSDLTSIDVSLKMKLTWKNNKVKEVIMRKAEATGSQNIGEFPIVSFVLTR